MSSDFEILPADGQPAPKPLVRTLGSGEIRVPSIESLTERLEFGLFRWPYVEVLRAGKPIAVNRFSERRPIGEHFKAGFASWQLIRKLLNDAHVLRIHNVEDWDADFAVSVANMTRPQGLKVRSKVLMGGPQATYEEPASTGIAAAIIMPLREDAGIATVLTNQSGHELKHTAHSAREAILVPAAHALRLSFEGQGIGAALLVQLMMPTPANILDAIVRRFQDSADPELLTRYHRLGAQETKRRTHAELARIVNSMSTEDWMAEL